MTTLLLRLAGPMQSWGIASRFTQRETRMEPSKSGVIGLLCAALGMARDADAVERGGRRITLDTLATMPMAMRVEREGTVERDYHTTGGAHLHMDIRHEYGVAQAGGGTRIVESERFYLADADFLVALGGDGALLTILHTALVAPVWQIALGRKAFVPALPVYVADDPAYYGPPLRDGSPLAVLRAEPWRAGRPRERTPIRLRVVYDPAASTDTMPTTALLARRHDVPISFAITRREYRVRAVVTDFITPPNPEKGGDTDVPVTPAREPA